MIRELFLPTVLRGKRYFTERILGVALEESGLRAAVVRITSRSRTIEKIIEEKVDEKKVLDAKSGWHPKLLVQPLASLIKSAGTFDRLTLSIPASLVVFKEVELPFAEREKIKMVIEYEVEPMLPFTLNEAVLDFITPRSADGQNNYRVIVGAVRRSDIQKLADACAEAGINPHNISIDLFGLYSIVKQTERAALKEGTSILLEVAQHSTKVTLLENGNLRFIRIISHGLESLNFQPPSTEQAETATYEKLRLYGVLPTGESEYDQAINQACIKLFKEIEFTINSFVLKTKHLAKPQMIFLAEREFPIKGFSELCQEHLDIPVFRLSPEKLVSTAKLKNRATARSEDLYAHLAALGTATLQPEHEDFSLGNTIVASAEKPLIRRQIMVAMILTLAVIVAVGAHGYIQLSELSETAHRAEGQAKKTLTSLIPKNNKKRRRAKTLKRLMAAAHDATQLREIAWNQFGCQSVPALEVLLELTRVMDRHRFEVTIEHFNMSGNEKGLPVLELEGLLASKKGAPKAEFSTLWKQILSSKLLEELRKPEAEFDEKSQAIKFSALLAVKQT